MTDEQAKQEITSVLSEAGKGIPLWFPYLHRNEIDQLLNATAIIKAAKDAANRRQKEKAG